MGDCNIQHSYCFVICSDTNDARRVVPVCDPDDKLTSVCFTDHPNAK